MPAWYFDEFRHIGVDFSDPERVRKYDAQQKTSLEKERQLARKLGIVRGAVVIEFGGGTGAFTLAAAELGAHVISVDISAAMLDYSQHKATEAGITSIEFVQKGFLSYEHHGVPADFAVSKFSFHHLPDFWKVVALQRIQGMLKKRGMLYLEDVVFSFPVEEAASKLEQWIDTIAGESGEGFSRSDYEMHIRDEFSSFGWILEAMLKQTGFVTVEADYYAPTYAKYVCLKA